MVFVNKLMAVFGQPNADYYGATDVSRDGSRILAVGNPPLIAAQTLPTSLCIWHGLRQVQHLRLFFNPESFCLEEH
jgi:hypothetical protein